MSAGCSGSKPISAKELPEDHRLGLLRRDHCRLDVALEAAELGLDRIEAVDLDIAEIPERVDHARERGGETEQNDEPDEENADISRCGRALRPPALDPGSINGSSPAPSPAGRRTSARPTPASCEQLGQPAACAASAPVAAGG